MVTTGGLGTPPLSRARPARPLPFASCSQTWSQLPLSILSFNKRRLCVELQGHSGGQDSHLALAAWGRGTERWT